MSGLRVSFAEPAAQDDPRSPIVSFGDDNRTLQTAYQDAVNELQVQQAYTAKLRQLVVEQHHARQEDRIVWQCREEVLINELKVAEAAATQNQLRAFRSEANSRSSGFGGPGDDREAERLLSELRTSQRRRIDLEAEVTAWALSATQWEQERRVLVEELHEARSRIPPPSMRGPAVNLTSMNRDLRGAHGVQDERERLREEIEHMQRAELDADWRAHVAESNAEYARMQVDGLRAEGATMHSHSPVRKEFTSPPSGTAGGTLVPSGGYRPVMDAGMHSGPEPAHSTSIARHRGAH